jgi:SAM-dependent methyltransferase
VTLATRAWIAAHRLRRRMASGRPDREALVRELAPGGSFLDVGCMWSVHGRIAFVAEESGATAVTGIDLMGRTEAFEAEHARRRSAVRFVHGDLHDPATLAAAGPHDVVWCSGVLYHAPHPLLTLERLREVCGRRLILSTESLPELPGVRGGCVFYPALSARDRRAYAGVPGGRAIGLTSEYDPAQGYGNWFWGITPSALLGLLHAAGFVPERVLRAPFHTTVLATPRRPAPG